MFDGMLTLSKVESSLHQVNLKTQELQSIYNKSIKKINLKVENLLQMEKVKVVNRIKNNMF
jgi:hypothetical protein